jgi:hypothetical protein
MLPIAGRRLFNVFKRAEMAVWGFEKVASRRKRPKPFLLLKQECAFFLLLPLSHLQ